MKDSLFTHDTDIHTDTETDIDTDTQAYRNTHIMWHLKWREGTWLAVRYPISKGDSRGVLKRNDTKRDLAFTTRSDRGIRTDLGGT